MNIRRVVVDGGCNGYDCDSKATREHGAYIHDIVSAMSWWDSLNDRAEVDEHPRHGGEWILEIAL